MTQEKAQSLPPMSPVESTNIQSIGRDEAANKTFIRFKSGGAYSYADVPKSTHDAFMAAPSKGTFFKAAFAGKFQHTKLGGT